jgi:hypothetical protein
MIASPDQFIDNRAFRPPIPGAQGAATMPTRRFSPPFCRGLALSLAALLILESAAPAWAWGRLGHRVSVIARLAERQLTDRAKAAIRFLLEPGESPADG